jgi:hypothetical protein
MFFFFLLLQFYVQVRDQGRGRLDLDRFTPLRRTDVELRT